MSQRRRALFNLGLNGLGLVRKLGDKAVTVDGDVWTIPQLQRYLKNRGLEL